MPHKKYVENGSSGWLSAVRRPIFLRRSALGIRRTVESFLEWQSQIERRPNYIRDASWSKQP